MTGVSPLQGSDPNSFTTRALLFFFSQACFFFALAHFLSLSFATPPSPVLSISRWTDAAKGMEVG